MILPLLKLVLDHDKWKRIVPSILSVMIGFFNSYFFEFWYSMNYSKAGKGKYHHFEDKERMRGIASFTH